MTAMDRDPDPSGDPFACSICGGPLGELRRIEGHDVCKGCSSQFIPDPFEDDAEYIPDAPGPNSDSDTGGVEGQYATRAVESSVLDESGDEVGHVALFDLDEVGIEAARHVARVVGGYTVILRSSPGSYHVWGLSVRPIDEIIEIAAGLEAVDREHTALSNQRDCCVVRIEEKIAAATGRTVADKPVFREAIAQPSALPQSKPHWAELAKMLDVDLDPKPGYEWVGDRLRRRVFLADIPYADRGDEGGGLDG